MILEHVVGVVFTAPLGVTPEEIRDTAQVFVDAAALYGALGATIERHEGYWKPTDTWETSVYVWFACARDQLGVFEAVLEHALVAWGIDNHQHSVALRVDGSMRLIELRPEEA